MKPENKNIVNQLVKEAAKLPNDDYFTDLSAQLLRQINTPKAPVIPIYKKLGLENSVLICEMDIAINNYYLKKYSESIEGLKEVLSKINTNQDHFPIMIRSNLFISKSYFDQKDYFNAKRYFKIVEDLLSENPHEFDMMLKEIILESKINFLIEDRKYTEAKRIILLLPQMTPGYFKEDPVRVMMSIPISFSLY